MTLSSVLLIGADQLIENAVRQAVCLIFPDATLRTVPSLEEAGAHRDEQGVSLWIFARVPPAGIKAAFEEVDGAGLPRRPVIAIGHDAIALGLTTASAADLEPGALAAMIRAELARFQLARDYARACGDLLTIGRRIIHDLRAPLGGILTTAELLREEVGGQVPSSVSLVEAIANAAEEMAQILDRVGLLTKASAFPTKPERIDMGWPVVTARERLGGLIRRRAATVTAPERWPVVEGVASWLDTIWRNLLENALNHAGKEPRIELGWEIVGEEYRFFVRDNGPGVPDAKRKDLFQPFHRLHEPNAVNRLGLSLVQRLVELLGGRSGYDTDHETRASFCFTLPAANCSPPSSAEPVPAATATGPSPGAVPVDHARASMRDAAGSLGSAGSSSLIVE